MAITHGELRARLQPTILLRATDTLPAVEGGTVFEAGTLLFAMYAGDGNILLSPVVASQGAPAIVKASQVNSRATLLSERELGSIATVYGTGPALRESREAREQRATAAMLADFEREVAGTAPGQHVRPEPDGFPEKPWDQYVKPWGHCPAVLSDQ
jgi:hypothetical protein